MTSEYLHAYDTSIGNIPTYYVIALTESTYISTLPIIADDDSGEKSVSVLLAGEESELIFLDQTTSIGPVSIVFTKYHI
jgi:hypothetical protein